VDRTVTRILVPRRPGRLPSKNGNRGWKGTVFVVFHDAPAAVRRALELEGNLISEGWITIV
jgi:hypothetical protein